MRNPSVPGRVAGLFKCAKSGRSASFVTRATNTLTLDLAGIPGNRHNGVTRASGPREPWLPRGSILRNDRQISALCSAELAEIANRLDIASLPPEWIGGNLLIEGFGDFSRIAPGSRFAFGGAWGGKGRFDGTAVLRVEAYNVPCRAAGRAISVATGEGGHEFAFVKAALALRGLMLSVDLPGTIGVGDPVVLIGPIVPKAVG
jgi:hypothetical protein